ncbi:MAG: tRNA (adenosine(37)-N6)-threonylcarbamoyltransferase complex dimerization subunit type 1 TsaB [Candidatus Omnitrophica bacterium]|nr:tRNA (adenosine(37)-N6)-threonylcarbamoyltransferase complex dimerization subunit type 1 TsaB [Candidatus Omnitrophota bacterium]
MNILSIDTSTDYLSVAITDGVKVLARYHRPSHRNHSRLLIPTISSLIKKTGLETKDIDGFCVSVGPGSFTGLRIGVVTVKGLSYTLNKPIVTVPTLDVIARNAKGFKGIVCPVIDAKKNKVYACLYKSDGKNFKKVSKYLLISVESLLKMTEKYDKVLFLGDAVKLVGSKETIKDWHPRADAAAGLATESFKKKIFVSPEKLEPMYIYSKECNITGK